MDCRAVTCLRPGWTGRLGSCMWRHHRRFVRGYGVFFLSGSITWGSHVGFWCLWLRESSLYLRKFSAAILGYPINIKAGEGKGLKKKTLFHFGIVYPNDVLGQTTLRWNRFLFLSLYLHCDLRQTLSQSWEPPGGGGWVPVWGKVLRAWISMLSLEKLALVPRTLASHHLPDQWIATNSTEFQRLW